MVKEETINGRTKRYVECPKCKTRHYNDHIVDLIACTSLIPIKIPGSFHTDKVVQAQVFYDRRNRCNWRKERSYDGRQKENTEND